MSPLSVLKLLGYYLSLFFFGFFGAELCLFSLLTAVLPATPGVERFHQRLIHWHFRLFHWWCRLVRQIIVEYRGFERIPPGGKVIAANHPALIDITCLLARIPEAFCIFKPAIRRNPVMGAGARRAGYLASDGGHDLVRRAAEKVTAGSTLVVFPEGTRTAVGEQLLPLKPGFVLIAQRARAPIQLIRITTNSNLLTKRIAWWKLPIFPANVLLEVGPLLAHDPAKSPEEVTAEIEAWFRTGPGAPPPAAAGAGG